MQATTAARLRGLQCYGVLLRNPLAPPLETWGARGGVRAHGTANGPSAGTVLGRLLGLRVCGCLGAVGVREPARKLAGVFGVGGTSSGTECAIHVAAHVWCCHLVPSSCHLLQSVPCCSCKLTWLCLPMERSRGRKAPRSVTGSLPTRTLRNAACCSAKHHLFPTADIYLPHVRPSWPCPGAVTLSLPMGS